MFSVKFLAVTDLVQLMQVHQLESVRKYRFPEDQRGRHRVIDKHRAAWINSGCPGPVVQESSIDVALSDLLTTVRDHQICPIFSRLVSIQLRRDSGLIHSELLSEL